VRRLFALFVVLVLAGCSADSYPLLPQGSSEWHPAAIGSPVRGVVLYLEPHPGDRIELVSAEAVGSLTGAKIHFYFSPPVLDADGSRTIGEKLLPLAGARVSVDAGASQGPVNDVGIVVEMTAMKAGTYTLTSVRLHFRLNGGPEQMKEGITSVFTVCADDPAPENCGPMPP
jgi:hypothetical protein